VGETGRGLGTLEKNKNIEPVQIFIFLRGKWKSKSEGKTTGIRKGEDKGHDRWLSFSGHGKRGPRFNTCFLVNCRGLR